jgi:hypothetical protein
MKTVNEKVDMGNFTTIEVNEFGELMVIFDDSDLMVEVPLDARDVYEHLREFFGE